jgi:hypothetical protein
MFTLNLAGWRGEQNRMAPDLTGFNERNIFYAAARME